MANLIAAFSVNSLALALPVIAADFGTAQSNVSWLTLVYSLVPCCTLLLFGRMAELHGYRKQMILGFAVFGLVSALTPAVSRSIGILIFMRCLQGVAYAIMVSITQAIVSRAFPPAERGKALGTNTVFVSVGLAAGPTLGGLLIKHFSWKSIFYFNIPFAVLGIAACLLVMPKDETDDSKKARMDYSGALLLAAACGGLCVGLNFLKNKTNLGISPLWLIAAAVLAFVLFFLREKRAGESALVPMSLFADRSFSQCNIVLLGLFIAQQMVVYMMPFYLEDICALPSDTAGFYIMASPLCMIIFAPIGGTLKDRCGTKLPSILGFSILLASIVFLSTLSESTPHFMTVTALAGVGIGAGLGTSPVNTTIMNSAPRERSGVASGTLATMRNLGQTMGVACSTLILEARQAVYIASADSSGAYLMAQRDTFLFGCLTLTIAIVLIVLLPRSGSKNTAARK